MFDFVESRVRRVVAEQLAVNPEELRAEISLTDELAADSLDLLEVALALEGEFDIEIPESRIDQIRTYGDVLGTVQALTRGRREEEDRTGANAPSALVWARVVSPRGVRGDLQRAGWLTPYTAQIIVEDALRAGSGARLEVTVPSSLSDAGLARLQDEFACLGGRGVQVNVRRDRHLGPVGHGVRPDAAA
jgi:acyl carrier protein